MPYEFETEEINTFALEVGDLVLSWGNQWRKCLSVSRHVAICEYVLEDEEEPHRHSGWVKQLIKKRQPVTI